MFRFLKKASPEEKFWNWFTRHSQRIFCFEKDQNRVFDELSEQLDNIHTSLTFEFGPVVDGRREFIISAEGDKEAFPSVLRLASATPPLLEWIVIPFRPPKDLARYPSVRIDGLELSVDDVFFSYEIEGAMVHIHLFIKGWNEENDQQLGGAVFLLLDAALGEYVVETRIGGISRHPYVASEATELLPLREIASVVVLPKA